MKEYKKFLETDKKIKIKLASLIKKYKDVDKISVIELAKECEISRSTFYSHYQSIKDVVSSIKHDYVNDFIDSVTITNLDDIEKFVIHANRYLKSNDDFIRKLFSSKNTFSIALASGNKIKNKIMDSIDQEIVKKYRKEIYLELSIYVDGYITQLVHFFVDSNCIFKLKDIHASLLDTIDKFKMFVYSLF